VLVLKETSFVYPIRQKADVLDIAPKEPRAVWSFERRYWPNVGKGARMDSFIISKGMFILFWE